MARTLRPLHQLGDERSDPPSPRPAARRGHRIGGCHKKAPYRRIKSHPQDEPADTSRLGDWEVCPGARPAFPAV